MPAWMSVAAAFEGGLRHDMMFMYLSIATIPTCTCVDFDDHVLESQNRHQARARDCAKSRPARGAWWGEVTWIFTVNLGSLKVVFVIAHSTLVRRQTLFENRPVFYRVRGIFYHRCCIKANHPSSASRSPPVNRIGQTSRSRRQVIGSSP